MNFKSTILGMDPPGNNRYKQAPDKMSFSEVGCGLVRENIGYVN